MVTQTEVVKRLLSACAIALLAIALAGTGTEAQSISKAKATNRTGPSPAILACYKQAGVSYNRTTGRWTMYSGENDGIIRQDSLRRCIAQAKGGSPGSVAIHEHETLQYGGPPRTR
jgi:hypothetical protein